MRKLTTVFSLVLLAAFFAYGHIHAQNDQELIGEIAPSFNLKNIDGSMVSLNDYVADENVHGVIVIFTCNHCPYSKLYEDRIVALDKQFKAQGYPVVAINPNDPEAYPEDDFAGMKKRAKEKGFTFPYLVDETQEIAEAYGATRTPHTYLLQKDEDQFEVVYVGAIDDNPKDDTGVEVHYVNDAIQNAVEGQRVETNYTKAIGCSIKWKKS